MKRINCHCGRVIEVMGGIAGLRNRFPQEIYLCECGYAYIPQQLGCMGAGLEDTAEPEALSPLEYADFKKFELLVASKYNPSPKAIIEIPAKVLSDKDL